MGPSQDSVEEPGLATHHTPILGLVVQMDQTGERRPEATGLSEQGFDRGLMDYLS